MTWYQRCKNRHKALTRAWREANPERMADLQRAWRKRNPERVARNARKSRLRRKFAMTPEAWDALLASQNGGCAICNKPAGNARGDRLAVDHDHRTEVVRGLLCGDCNLGIGKFQEDFDMLTKAAAYLRKMK